MQTRPNPCHRANSDIILSLHSPPHSLLTLLFFSCLQTLSYPRGTYTRSVKRPRTWRIFSGRVNNWTVATTPACNFASRQSLHPASLTSPFDFPNLRRLGEEAQLIPQLCNRLCATSALCHSFCCNSIAITLLYTRRHRKHSSQHDSTVL